jgi:site-specific recombinase XerD
MQSWFVWRCVANIGGIVSGDRGRRSSNAILTIRDSKFFKTRLVPIGPKTAQVLAEYASWRDSPSKKTHTPFFVGRNGKPVPIHMFERAFKQIRVHAGLHREPISLLSSI